MLYFAMIELLMLDSSRELAQARRFRATIIAQTLAENGAELAALQLTDPSAETPRVNQEDWQGRVLGTVWKGSAATDESGRTQQPFILTGTGEVAGVTKARATVKVTGRIENSSKVLIDYAQHSR